MKNKNSPSLQIKNDSNHDSINQDNNFIKSVGNSRVRNKNTFCEINKLNSNVTIFDNESSDSYGKIKSILIKEKSKDEIRFENSNNKNAFKKIIFDKDVRVKDTIKLGIDPNSNNFTSRYSLKERTKTKLPNQNYLIEDILNSNLNEKSNKKTKSSSGTRKVNINKFEDQPSDEIVSIPLNRDIIELTNINFLNLRNEQLKKKMNHAFTSTSFIYDNYKFRGDPSKPKKDGAHKSSVNNSESNQKNKSYLVLTSSNKITNLKFTNTYEDEKNTKLNNDNSKGLASAYIKTKKKSLVLNNIDKKFNYENINNIPSPNSKRNPSAGKYYFGSATERKERNNTGKNRLFSHSELKNKNEIINTKAFITEKSVEKPKWINSSILDPKDKSIILETKSERKEEVVLKSGEEFLDPEINAIYNKLFDKYFRKIIDTKTPKTKELQDQIRKYLKLRGKPCYIDEKIKDIKTKIFFIKGIFDFVYPEVLANKLKVQKEYYEIMIKELQESNKMKQEKMQLKFKKQDSSGIAASEFYVLKNRSQSSKNFYPKIQSAMKSEVKIKTQTKNFFRNIISSHSNRKKNELDYE